MKLNRVLEQHVAVFGESGSGKTVLVSSFHGATQEPESGDVLRVLTAGSAGWSNLRPSNDL